MEFPKMQDKKSAETIYLEEQNKNIDSSQERLKSIESKLDTIINMIEIVEVNTNETKE